jgi:hypothetical protein
MVVVANTLSLSSATAGVPPLQAVSKIVATTSKEMSVSFVLIDSPVVIEIHYQ